MPATYTADQLEELVRAALRARDFEGVTIALEPLGSEDHERPTAPHTTPARTSPPHDSTHGQDRRSPRTGPRGQRDERQARERAQAPRSPSDEARGHRAVTGPQQKILGELAWLGVGQTPARRTAVGLISGYDEITTAIDVARVLRGETG